MGSLYRFYNYNADTIILSSTGIINMNDENVYRKILPSIVGYLVIAHCRKDEINERRRWSRLVKREMASVGTRI